MKVRITFTEPILGTWPADKEIARTFIASNAPDAPTREEEIENHGVDAVVERGKTVFPRQGGNPVLYDYQIKGFFKDTCGMLARIKTTQSAKLRAYKKIIDGLVFVSPRHIPICFDGDMGECQRPLRAQTAQGERVSLAISEEIPTGATVDFEVVLFDESHEKALREWLDYGIYRGIGQWRNSGKGRFTWEEIKE